MRDYGEFARNAVRVWMRNVMQEKGWNPNEWAFMAGTSPTNITRFLSPGSKLMPSVDTVCKLAIIARSQPNLIGSEMSIVETEAEAVVPNVNFCPDCGFDLRRVTPQPDGHQKAS